LLQAKGDFNFSIFAAFYAAAQIIERAMELVTPLLPVDVSGATGDDGKVAQAKADRAKMALAVASVAGVVVANAFALFFSRNWVSTPATPVDSIGTGLVIAAGTKPRSTARPSCCGRSRVPGVAAGLE
jgi:hypothetical protein